MINTSLYFNKHIVIGVVVTTAVIFSVYVFNMVVVFHTAIFTKTIITPILLGVFSGYYFGFLFNQRKVKQKFLYDAMELQDVLKEILLLSHQDLQLKEIFDKTIQLILGTSFANVQNKGGIFIASKTGLLLLKSHVNLPQQIIKNCGTKGVEFGECLCGIAAQEQKTIFKHCVDHNHTIQFDGMTDHGHYNVPIMIHKKVLGVIVIYLDANHLFNQLEVDFLEAIANVLAIVINKINVDEKVVVSDSSLKEMQQFAKIGTWALNIKTSNVTASDEVYTIMGYLPQEFPFNEKLFLDATHENDVEKVSRALENAKLGTPFEIEARYYDKEGAIIHIINKCQPKLFEKNHVIELNGIIIDVTELRKNEEALFEKQSLVNGILSAIPDMLYLIDLNTNEFVYYNHEMEKVLKKRPDFHTTFKKQGMDFFKSIVYPKDIHIYEELEFKLFSGENFITIRFRGTGPTNDYRWYEQRVLVYDKAANGAINQLLITAKDVHENVLAENRIKKLNKKLTTQYTDIKKINNELDHFVYSVSHDLRSPLASILGLINLSKIESSEHLRGYLEKIGASTEKLDSFISDILDYSRNARTEINIETFNLNELVG